MSDKTKIEWTEATWNPTTGCSKVSPGCKNCYAKRDWARLSANPKTVYYGREFEDVATHEDRLTLPLRWTKPRLIFVNSMSDLFHKDVPQAFIQDVWVTMALARARGHRFQILTKRAERMPESVAALDVEYIKAIYDASTVTMPAWEYPLPNVWLGVSVEDQQRAKERIPFLVKTPAAVRFLSCEPLLGKIDLGGTGLEVCLNGLDEPSTTNIHWVIAGGESGPGSRPMHPDWARHLRDQCYVLEIPFLFKQWGNWLPYEVYCDPPFYQTPDGHLHDGHGLNVLNPHTGDESEGWDAGFWTIEEKLPPCAFRNVGKKAAGRELDMRTWDEYPK